MYKLALKKYLDDNNISRYTLVKSAGMRYQTINNLYNNNVKSINFNVLDKICKTLNCTPNDLIIDIDENDEHEESDDE